MQKLIKGKRRSGKGSYKKLADAHLKTMQQQTRAIHIVRAEPQKSQMIKRNHRFIFCKGSHSLLFDTLARRPLVAINTSDILRISALDCMCPGRWHLRSSGGDQQVFSA